MTQKVTVTFTGMDEKDVIRLLKHFLKIGITVRITVFVHVEWKKYNNFSMPLLMFQPPL